MKTQLSTRSLPGFTLVETLIAITILMTAIVGPFTVAQGVLATSYTARDQLIASSLAQEGVEYVRYIRDSNFLSTIHGTTVTWLNGLDGNNGPNCYYQSSLKSCAIDPGGVTTVQQCTNNTCAELPLYINSANRYTLTPVVNQTARFTRIVQLRALSARETQVIVTVTWNSHGAHSVQIVDDLQNWL